MLATGVGVGFGVGVRVGPGVTVGVGVAVVVGVVEVVGFGVTAPAGCRVARQRAVNATTAENFFAAPLI